MSYKAVIKFDSVERVIADITAGKTVVVIDNEDRKNEGDIISAVERATPELVASMIRYSSGYICAPLIVEDHERPNLLPMVSENEDACDTVYTVAVNANVGTTGISATDRANIIRTLADSISGPRDSTRPGRVIPLRAREGGILVRVGHTEVAVGSACLAGLRPAGIPCGIVPEEDPTSMARSEELCRSCDRHDLALVSIERLAGYRRHNEHLIERIVETGLPTNCGEFHTIGYRNLIDGVGHAALVVGDVSSNDGQDVLVRAHSECLTGDALGSHRYDCDQQLYNSIRVIYRAGYNVVLYIRGYEGRGIGLTPKPQAYRLQDKGVGIVGTNPALGLPPDTCEYGTGAQILQDLGVISMTLLTNNPTKHAGLGSYRLEMSRRVPAPAEVNENNLKHLLTKRERMGHKLPWLDEYIKPHGISTEGAQ